MLKKSKKEQKKSVLLTSCFSRMFDSFKSLSYLFIYLFIFVLS